MIGDNIRMFREKKGMKQTELAKAIGISTVTLSRYENNTRAPRAEDLIRLADALDTSVAALIETGGATNSQATRVGTPWHVDVGDADIEIPAARIDFAKSAGKSIPVPVYGHELSVCCGDGFPDADQIFAEAEEFIAMPSSFIGPYDPERPPFIIYADGDSMVDAGISDGSQVIINPADPVLDGDAALVEFAVNPVVRSIAVKRVYWLDNHGVEIRSACGDGWRRRFTSADGDEKSIRIIGKVEWGGHKPRRG